MYLGFRTMSVTVKKGTSEYDQYDRALRVCVASRGTGHFSLPSGLGLAL